MKAGLKHLWSRRWVRRLTYLVVGGGTLAGIATWTANRPATNRWVVRNLSEWVLAETGLPFTAERLDLEPFIGRAVLRNATWGGDFVQAERVEVHLDLRSLFGSRPRIFAIRVERPRIELSQRRLSQIHLRPRPRPKESAQVLVDFIRVSDGSLHVREPLWGLPEGTFTFKVQATGLGPNHLLANLDVSRADLRLPHGEASGKFDLVADLSEARIQVRKAEALVGPAYLKVVGSLDPAGRKFDLRLEGKADLARTLSLLTGERRNFQGLAAFQATAEGPLSQPAWTLDFKAPEIRPLEGPFHSGSLDLKAQGTLDQASIRRFHWASPDGDLSMEGSWSRGRATQLSLDLVNLDLDPIAAWTKVDSLKNLRGAFQGDLELPGDPWSVPRWDKIKLRADGSLERFGEPMGDLDLEVTAGKVDLRSLQLRLDALQVDGTATATLGRRGLDSLQAQGFVFTDAARVSDALKAWKVVDLDMAGYVQAKAEDVHWDRKDGLRVLAQGEVTGPRWHGASADHVSAGVQILGDRLTATNIVATRAGGKALGELWLTWGDLPPGADQIDMCFRADRLPITQGLAAADLDLPITGTASGWARIHGPFRRLQLDGDVVVSEGRTYGVILPAVSGTFSLDLEGERLRIPEFRVAASLEGLDPDHTEPSGPLALKGELDMDLKRATWRGAVAGPVDTGLLGLPGPQVQAVIQGRLQGPWTSPFGPIDLPTGQIAFQKGRLFLGNQSIEDLEGALTTAPRHLEGTVGLAGKGSPILRVAGDTKGPDLLWAADLQADDATLDMEALARRSTHDLVRGGALQAHVQGLWTPRGLDWKGRLDRLWARFAGFDLGQTQPSLLTGTLAGLAGDLRLGGLSQAGSATDPGGNAQLHLSGRAPFSTTAPMDLRAEGEAQVAYLKGLLDLLLDLDENSLLAQLKPQGKAQVDVRLGGSFSDPTLNGFAALSEGRLQVRTYPQSIEDLAFRLTFQGKDILLDPQAPLRGRLAQGTLRASGKATWQLRGLASYDLDASLLDFQLRDLPGLEGLDMSGNLQARLSGNDEEGGLLEGRLEADRVTYQADLRLTDLLLNNSLATASRLDVDDPLARIDLDLDLVLKQPWRFDTNLLKVEGRTEGSFKVQGNLLNPGLKGKMVLLPGGRVTNLLPAGDIVLERGELDFTDPYRVNPVFNLQGRVDVPPYLVSLSFNGNLDQFSFSATSTPNLRQDEVVAILVDPTLAATIGTGPATSQSTLSFGIANAGAGILSSAALAAFQESLRKTFNLDRANVSFRSSTGVTESTLTLGKTVDLFGARIPLLFTYRKVGDVLTLGGQAEISAGNWVIQIGASGSDPKDINPTGEIRYSWSPRR